MGLNSFLSKKQWASTTWDVLSQAMQLITFWVRFAVGVNLYNTLTCLPWWPTNSLLAFTWTDLSWYLTYSWQFLTIQILKPEGAFTSFNLTVQSVDCQGLWSETCRIFELHEKQSNWKLSLMIVYLTKSKCTLDSVINACAECSQKLGVSTPLFWKIP